MSVNISVSNTKQTNCKHIVEKFFNFKINCRVIETLSVVDDNIETGCLITFGKEYNDKTSVNNIWNLIKKDYICSHIKIDGLFDGCIYDYIRPSNCPGN